MEIVANVLKALYLHGYRYKGCRALESGHNVRVYANARGIEMLLFREGNEAALASQDVKALEFINDVLNGAYAG